MRLRVMLEYFYPWTNSAGFYIARDRGWYRDIGLDVELAIYDPVRGDGLDYVVNGEADMAICPTKRLLVYHELGRPIASVAAINHRGFDAVRALKSSGMTRPRDLVGKRIALHPSDRGVAMVRHIVAHDGGDPDLVTLVDIGERQLSLEEIAASNIDATFGSYWAWEAVMDSVIPADQQIVWPVDQIGAPTYHSYLLAVHNQLLDQPEIVRQFSAATRCGYQAAAQEPDAVVAVYARVAPYFPESLIRRSWPLVAQTWTHKGTW